MLRLIGISGQLVGQTLPLGPSETTLGRVAANSISFPNDSGTSRRHARLLVQGESLIIEDLGSSNGTFVNGNRISTPMPLFAGDEVRIGEQSFRVEPAVGTTPRRQEVSQGEAAKTSAKKSEQSGIKESLYGSGGGSGDFGGCSNINIDLSGCLRMLFYLFLILLAILVLGLIGLLISSVVGGLGAAGSAVGGAGGAGSGSSGQSGGSQNAPKDQPQQQPPPPTEAQQTQGVQILSVKVDFARRTYEKAYPIVLVKWKNASAQYVNRFTGKVMVFDSTGKLLIEKPNITLYPGPAVGPGEIHEDTLSAGGIVILDKLRFQPKTARIEILRVE